MVTSESDDSVLSQSVGVVLVSEPALLCCGAIGGAGADVVKWCYKPTSDCLYASHTTQKVSLQPNSLYICCNRRWQARATPALRVEDVPKETALSSLLSASKPPGLWITTFKAFTQRANPALVLGPETIQEDASVLTKIVKDLDSNAEEPKKDTAAEEILFTSTVGPQAAIAVGHVQTEPTGGLGDLLNAGVEAASNGIPDLEIQDLWNPDPMDLPFTDEATEPYAEAWMEDIIQERNQIWRNFATVGAFALDQEVKNKNYRTRLQEIVSDLQTMV